MSLRHARIKFGVIAFTAALATASVATGCAPSGGGGTPAAPQTSASAGVNEAARALLPASIRDKGTMSVANTLNYPPFEYKNPDGTNQGFNIDLINGIGSTLGVKAEVQQVPFEGEIAGLTSNRFDLAMATFTITPERRKQVNFVQFLSAGTQVTVLKGSSTGIQGVDTLCGKTVGVTTGSVAQDQIKTLSDNCTKAGSPAINVSVFQSQTALVQAVLNGRVQAKLDDSTTVAYINEKTGGKLEDVGEPYEPTPTGFAVAKNNTDLLKASQAALQAMIDNGQYGQLLEKWGQSANAVKTATVYTDTEPAASSSPSPSK